MYLTPLHLPKPSVLVLEEDSDLRTVLGTLLTDFGYGLADGSKAGHVDLVLASVGARTASWAPLWRPDHAAPVIMLVDRTAWSGFDFFDAANKLGAAAVLQRPFARAALLRLITIVLAGAAGKAGGAEPAAEEQSTALLRSLENPNFV